MSLTALLPFVLVLPLAAAVGLALAGRRLPARYAGPIATTAVGLSFLLSAGIAAAHLSAPLPQGAGAGGRPAIVRSLWTWIEAGDDLVEVTISLEPLAQAMPIPAGAVGRTWTRLDQPGIRAVLPDVWDPVAVVGEMPIGRDLPAYTPLTQYNVPPGDAGFQAATPRIQRGFVTQVALQLDGLSLAMMLVVTGVGFLILMFATGYMARDPDRRRFFAYMSLFVFSMLVLVLGADFLVLFAGWELVGLCSYLLIGFWYLDPANASAGRKAFIVNRIGDFGFLLGLMLIWSAFGSLAYRDVLGAAGTRLPLDSTLAIAIAVLLLAGAVGKSAQVPLHVWLPDAMAGPTPVSALIHAATMVTAGVYMIVRAHALFERAPTVMALVAGVGAATALLAALLACVQVDIKRTLAFSTISQVGFMFLAAGTGAYVAAIFHLAMHAFFKALLFLGAGSVMHAMAHGFERHGEPVAADGVPPTQDMRRMGGLLRRLPVTGMTFLIGGLALAGLFPLAGFWSKDAILHAALSRSEGLDLWLVLCGVAIVTAFLTAFYTGRQLVLVLSGGARSEGAANAVESPLAMTVPLVALAVLTVFGGVAGIALGAPESPLAAILAPVVGARAEAGGPSPLAVAVLATAVALGGLGLAVLAYGPRPRLVPSRERVRASWAGRLAGQELGFDALYGRAFVRPFRSAADFLWRTVDDGVIDGAVNAVGRSAIALGQVVRRAQTGYVRTYLLSILLGGVALAAWLLLRLR
jgi:NADH-quinone oxidoreductase subunit L